MPHPLASRQWPAGGRAAYAAMSSAVVIELALILGINLCGLAFAGLLARWVLGRDIGGRDVRRLAGALERATQAFLWKESRLVAMQVLILAGVMVALYAYMARAAAQPIGLDLALASSLGVILGAVTACVVSHVAARIALRTALRTVAAVDRSLDRALTVSIRGGAVAGLVAESASLLGVCSLFGILYSIKGGFALADAEAVGPLVARVALLLPGYAFGAATGALVLQLAGARYQTSSSVGGDLAGRADAGLDEDDARNPAAIAAVVGGHVGDAANRSVDLFVSYTIASVTTLVVGARVVQANGGSVISPLALVFFPVVVRAFGLIASAFGVMVVRTDERDGAIKALGRGRATTAVVGVGGIAGATLWLLGQHYWLPFFFAGGLGALAAMAVSSAARWRTDRRFGAVRDVLESTRSGGAPTMTQGLGIGLEAVAVPVVVIGGALIAAWHLGEHTAIRGGGMLATMTALMAMLSEGVFMLALGTFSTITDNARAVAQLGNREARPPRGRAVTQLGEAGLSASAVAQTYFIAVGCSAAVIAGAVLVDLPGHEPPGVLGIGKPTVLWSGALGAVAVLAYAGRAVRRCTRAVRAVAMEVERQLRGFPREAGVADVPRDYTPSYRACIDITSRSALERLLPPVSAAILLPGMLALALRIVSRGADPALPIQALASYVVFAALTGLVVALALDAARAALGAARRAGGSSGISAGAAQQGGAVADVIGTAGAPAAHLVVKASAVAALTLSPFFV